ncbi:hypothetical protein B0H13DRAFT_2429554 [Mycena leptocephala]|nr:hypothetical protein B0H13DRAFT_2429554 [Mycena leptocephala]
MSPEKAHALLLLPPSTSTEEALYGHRADTNTNTAPTSAPTAAATPSSAIDTPRLSQSATAMATHVVPYAITVQILTAVMPPASPSTCTHPSSTPTCMQMHVVAANVDVQIAGLDVKLGLTLGSHSSKRIDVELELVGEFVCELSSLKLERLGLKLERLSCQARARAPLAQPRVRPRQRQLSRARGACPDSPPTPPLSLSLPPPPRPSLSPPAHAVHDTCIAPLPSPPLHVRPNLSINAQC